MAPGRPEAGPALLALGGLPGTGKTTLARALVRRMRAVLVRVDTIEQALRDAGLPGDLGPLGYAAAQGVAGDQLAAGYVVVADSVNPVEVTRSGWREVAARTGARLLEVEVTCSDPAEHRRRVEGRASDIPRLRLPTWEQVAERDYHPWAVDLTVDTAAVSAGEAAQQVEVALACTAPAAR